MKSVSRVSSMVKVIQGLNEGEFNLAGSSVNVVYESLRDAFNLADSLGYVRGKVVAENRILKPGETLEFIPTWGRKGAVPRQGHIQQPFPYFGGKRMVAPEVWRRFGDVPNYVEPFFGGGGMLLNRPAGGSRRNETVNDLDCFLVNFWRAAKFHPQRLARTADYPVSELDLHARHKWLVQQRTTIQEKIRSDEMWCDPQVAAWWVWGINQWIGSGWCGESQSRKKPHPHGRGVHRLSQQRPAIGDAGRGIHRPSSVCRSEQLSLYVDALAKRLERVRVLCGDWSRVVTPSVTDRLGITGILLDPPYTKESGRQENLYALDDYTVGHQVRDWAVENGGNPKLRIALCGFEEEYRMPPNWSVFEWRSQGSRSGHKERIWFSPNC